MSIGKRTFTALALACIFYTHPAHAVKSINSPYITKDALKLEAKSAYDFDGRDSKDGAQGYNISLAYGFTDWWAMKVEGTGSKPSADGSDLRMSAIKLETLFQFAPKGEEWIDTGARIGYERNLIGGPDTVQGKFIMAKTIGPTQTMANLILAKEVGDHAAKLKGSAYINTRYLYRPWLQPGIEWYSDFGVLRHTGRFDEQGHSAGPAIFGTAYGLKYEAAYLIGVSDAAPDGEVRTLLEYAWKF